MPYPGTMTTLLASRSARATSSALSSRASPSIAAAVPVGAVPKPPKTTLRIERFIARHMMTERMVPLAPTSAPVTISRSLESMKPDAAAAQPE
jgi:hypothetical protein